MEFINLFKDTLNSYITNCTNNNFLFYNLIKSVILQAQDNEEFIR